MLLTEPYDGEPERLELHTTHPGALFLVREHGRRVRRQGGGFVWLWNADGRLVEMAWEIPKHVMVRIRVDELSHLPPGE